MLRSTARSYVFLFALLSVIYHSNLRPIVSGDTLGASLVPFSIALDHTIRLDRFGPYIAQVPDARYAVHHARDGHWYSSYPIAGPVLVSPLYLPAALVPRLRNLPAASLIIVARIAQKFTAVALAAAAAVAMLALLRRLTSERAAWILTFVFALGTENWSIASQALWQHTFGDLAIVGCLWSVERWSKASKQSRWYWATGICAACAVAIRPTNLALAPALAAALWWQRARPMDYVRVALAPVVALALTASYNIAVFGHISGTYPAALRGNSIDGLLGVLISPSRGLLVYTPVAIFAGAAFFPRALESSRRYRPLIVAATVFIAAQIAIVSLWPIWWGGNCWGPRLLTEIMPPIVVLIAAGLPVFRRNGFRYVFAAAAVYCVLIQAIGVYCYPRGAWDQTPVNPGADRSRLWNWRDNPIGRTARAGIVVEPYSVVFTALTQGLPAAAKRLRDSEIKLF